ncbi:hypothetical protein BGZ96_003033 [Linnemannia gamsii]|uniref:HCP-like protein n=1 Tax=Linnemannia gamsii TaxID=64522 RepID=A0ABQ7JJS0_9FUNG|nr:hypothetical protein BGZ96_003033 [Linnemannia gamsii]
MLDRSPPEEQLQAVRSVNKSQPLSSLPPVNPDDVIYLEYHLHPDIQKPFLLWDDVSQAFDDALHVRHKAKVLPFLKGEDYRMQVYTLLEPRRIVAVPEAVLDVVVEDPLTNKEDTFSTRDAQQELLPPSYDEGNNNMAVVGGGSHNTTTSASITSATFSAQRDLVYGLQNITMENYTQTNRAATVSAAATGAHSGEKSKQHVANHPSRASQELSSAAGTGDITHTMVSAFHGDAGAQVALGDMYKDGRILLQDYQAAMEWYRKAADQEDAVGQRKVGVLYNYGLGVPQDYTKAMAWYLEAADQGNAQALCNIGHFYQYGQGVTQNFSKAMELYLKAADLGNPNSQSCIGTMYYNGDGVTQDFSESMKWYRKAADRGVPNAQFNVGLLHERGHGVPRDYFQAMEWYLKAANQGLDHAQYGAGKLYEDGRGVPQDKAKAMEWYSKAAGQGHVKAIQQARHLL